MIQGSGLKTKLTHQWYAWGNNSRRWKEMSLLRSGQRDQNPAEEIWKENSKTAYLKPASGNFRTRTWAQLHSNVYLISYYRPEPPGEGARPPLWLGINKDLLSPCTNSDPQFVTTKSSLSGLPEVLVAVVALTEHFLFSWLLPSKYFLNLKLMQTSVARQGKSDLKR